jgi:hypothetical protein
MSGDIPERVYTAAAQVERAKMCFVELANEICRNLSESESCNITEPAENRHVQRACRTK